MKIGQRIYNSVFPPLFEPSIKEKRLLRYMYPTINWEYVRYYNGLPWFMQNSFAIGTALPNAYDRRTVHVYFRDYHSMSPQQRIQVLVHEAFHIQQYQDLHSMSEKTSGWGFNRRFMRYYLGWYYQGLIQAIKAPNRRWSNIGYSAYQQHPMEQSAYTHERNFCSLLPQYQAHMIRVFIEGYPHLVCQYTGDESCSSPSLLAHILGTVTAVMISIIKPMVDMLLVVVALLLGGHRKG